MAIPRSISPLSQISMAIAICSAFVLAPIASNADTPEEQLAAASALFETHKYADAATRLDSFLLANPKHERAGAAAFTLGRCRTELKQYDRAILAYQRAISTKDDSIVTLAELGLAEAAMHLRQYDKAAPALEAALEGQLKPAQAGVAWLWLGESDFELKRYEKSEEAYTHATAGFPRADFLDEANYGLGLVELKLNQPDLAQQRFRQVIDRYPQSTFRFKARLQLAVAALESKQYQKARGYLEPLTRDPGVDEATKLEAEDSLTQVLLALNDYSAAIPQLESIFAKTTTSDPQYFKIALTLGNCYYHQKQYDNALTAYQTAAKSLDAGVAVEGLYWQANVNLAQDHPGEAAVLFNRLVTRYPKSDFAAKAALKAADSLAAAHQAAAAVVAYRAVIDKFAGSAEAATARRALAAVVENTNDPGQLAAALKGASMDEKTRGAIRIARLNIDIKKFADAVTAMTELLKSKPASSIACEADYVLGLALEGLNRPAPAAAAYGESVKLNSSAPWSMDANARLAWLYLDVKQPANAEKSANAVLQMKPEKQVEEQMRLALIQALVDQQKWDAAVDTCAVTLAGSPSPQTASAILYTQAWVEEKIGKPDIAAPLWGRILADEPNGPNAAEANTRIGDSMMRAEKYPDAAEYYGKVVSNFPTSRFKLEAQFKLGSALYNLGKTTEAAAAFIAVADDKTAGDYVPESLYWAGVALDKSGKKMDAIQRLSRLVTLYPKHARTPNAKIRLAALKATVGQ